MKRIVESSKTKFLNYEKSKKIGEDDKIVKEYKKNELTDVTLKENNELNLTKQEKIKKLEKELGNKIEDKKIELNNGISYL